jgi:hypothetical protein
MENKMIFTAEEKSFIIEADGKKLRVSYDEFNGNHEDAMEFCKEQGGGDETVENLRFIARHRDEINEALKKLGKEIITSWYWANEIAWWSADCAFVVSTRYGTVDVEGRPDTNYARAVSAL